MLGKSDYNQALQPEGKSLIIDRLTGISALHSTSASVI